ncbi:hypothetical protein ACJMK2_041255 [Sinanodonta woodiana]|uniref:Uncharacterized protein n=1 Tax=Sinanodonta woodiana TaxID=1069815 RepID=A0ABD3W6G0_SINWO
MMESRGEKRKLEDDDHDGVLSEAPRDILVLRYAESHAAEIDALLRDLQQTGGGKKVSQKLPRHMRRRATSHNIKRLPRKIRNMAATEYENQEDKVRKRPSRKYRRRPRNLLEEYNRRQKKSIWLETHIWHAKRFHMGDKYGFKIPLQPTSKGLRATYRAASHHCVLQDISYLCCIEVQGPQQSILAGLSHLTGPDTGLTFASKSCLNGTREGNTFVHEYDRFPWNLIGQVSFLWNTNLPCDDIGKNELTNQRQLWIWSHPSIYDQIWTELLKGFEIKQETSGVDLKSDNASGHSKNMLELIKIGEEPKAVKDGKKNSVLKNRTASNGTILVVSLRDCLNRFRLTGPLSHSVIVDCLQDAFIVGNDDSKGLHWWQTFYASVANSFSHSQQREFWDSLKSSQSPAECAPHCILGLTVRDPRICRPVKRTKLKLDPQGVQSDTSACCEKLSPHVSASPIWSQEIRQKVKYSKMSDHDINTLKSEQMVPGFPLDHGVEESSRIPILLLQQPGYQPAEKMSNPRCSRRSTGFGSGWDIITPSGWAMSFWISLVFRGARAIGILDSERLAQEQGMLHFPMDFPDCHAGLVEQKMRGETLEGKYKRMPPAKRPNYIKLGVTSPFSCPWSTLVQDWMRVLSLSKKSQNVDDIKLAGDGDSAKTDDMRTNSQIYADGEKYYADGRESTFFVLRNKKYLKQLNTVFQKKSLTKESNKTQDRLNNHSSENSLLNEADEFLNILEKEQPQALVPVEVRMLHKGCPTQMSMICIPARSDIEELQRNKSFAGPFEPQHKDSAEIKKRKIRKIIKEYETNKVVITQKLKSEIKEKVEMEFSDKNVENDPISRDIIGYVNNGGFSLAQGSGIGKGYCSLIGVVHNLRHCSIPSQNMTVLVRNPTSYQYRFAVISIMC